MELVAPLKGEAVPFSEGVSCLHLKTKDLWAQGFKFDAMVVLLLSCRKFWLVRGSVKDTEEESIFTCFVFAVSLLTVTYTCYYDYLSTVVISAETVHCTGCM